MKYSKLFLMELTKTIEFPGSSADGAKGIKLFSGLYTHAQSYTHLDMSKAV